MAEPHVTLTPIADLRGPAGPPGSDALGTGPQQSLIADWMNGIPSSNPVSDVIDGIEAGGGGGGGAEYYRPETYGALGNGTHDDGPAIQSAIDAAAAAGGGIVQLSAGKLYAFGVVITVKNAVFLVGTAGRQAPGYSSAPIVPGLVALNTAAQLKVGDWATAAAPGGAKNLYVDGNKIGSSAAAKKGLVRYAGVDAYIENVFANRSGGDGQVFDGLQNSTVVGGGSVMNQGTALVLDNGAGSVAFHGGYYGTSKKGAMEFRDTAGETSFYPFGPSCNTFFGTIWESYETTDFPSPHTQHVHLRCGLNNIFYGCNFTGGADNPGKAVMLIDALDNTVATVAIFDSCTWWSYANHDYIRIVGSNKVSLTGQHFCSDNGANHALSMICIDNGFPHILYGGEVFRNATVPIYRSINGGSTTQAFTEHVGGLQLKMDANQVLTVKQPTDTQNRWLLDQNGLMRWFDAAGAPKALLQRNPAGDGSGLLFSGGKFTVFNGLSVAGPFETVNAAAAFPTAGSSMVIDSSLRKHFQFVTTVAMAYSLSITNPVDGREVTIEIAATATPTVTWPTNARFAGGAAPVPGVGMTRVTLRYDATWTFWFETSRTVNIPLT